MPVESSVVVVNTSPLLALGACGQVELLHRLHGRVLVPDAVAREIARGVGAAPGGVGGLPAWVEVACLGSPVAPVLAAYLDDGEAAVIALALERRVPLVVVDERRGRRVARTQGLQVTGSLGVLLRGKRLGLVPAIKPSLDLMRSRGIWLGESLLAAVLREAGE